MAKLCVPQEMCAGVDVDGRRYRARNGLVEVPDRYVSRLKRSELFEPSKPVRAAGFICESCGFHAVFRSCSRCGGVCHRPKES